MQRRRARTLEGLERYASVARRGRPEGVRGPSAGRRLFHDHDATVPEAWESSLPPVPRLPRIRGWRRPSRRQCRERAAVRRRVDAEPPLGASGEGVQGVDECLHPGDDEIRARGHAAGRRGGRTRTQLGTRAFPPPLEGCGAGRRRRAAFSGCRTKAPPPPGPRRCAP